MKFFKIKDDTYINADTIRYIKNESDKYFAYFDSSDSTEITDYLFKLIVYGKA